MVNTALGNNVMPSAYNGFGVSALKNPPELKLLEQTEMNGFVVKTYIPNRCEEAEKEHHQMLLKKLQNVLTNYTDVIK